MRAVARRIALRKSNQRPTRSRSAVGGLELIVCDNNSTDRTAEIARAAGAAVVFEPVNQIARARNSGGGRPPATGWFLWTQIRIRTANVCRSCGANQFRLLSGRRVTMRMDEKHLVAGVATWLWNCAQPDWTPACRLVYFLRNGGVPKTRRFQQRIIPAEELELSRRLRKLAGNEPRLSSCTIIL